jgi:hypothetical protein
MPYGTVNADVIQTSTSGGVLGAGNASIMKNRIINGAMVINQRASTVTSGYSLDRWGTYTSPGSKLSISQNTNSVTPPTGFKNYLGVTSTSAYTVTATNYFAVYQRIEGYNISDLMYGTASAKTTTLSFWVQSSLTGTFGGNFTNADFSRSYPFTYTISSANTWEYKTITIAGDTTGTWDSTNSTGIEVAFCLGAGSTYGSGTAGAWTGSWTYPSGSTQLVATNNATFYITGCQLEVGSSSTGFEYVNYQTSLANCQRYYVNALAGSGVGRGEMVGMAYDTTNLIIGVALPVTLRTTPTIVAVTGTNYWRAQLNGSSYNTSNAISYDLLGNQYFTLNATFSGLTAGYSYLFNSNNSAATLAFSAEL